MNGPLSNYLFPPSVLWNWTPQKPVNCIFIVFQKSVSSRMRETPANHEAASTTERGSLFSKVYLSVTSVLSLSTIHWYKTFFTHINYGLAQQFHVPSAQFPPSSGLIWHIGLCAPHRNQIPLNTGPSSFLLLQSCSFGFLIWHVSYKKEIFWAFLPCHLFTAQHTECRLLLSCFVYYDSSLASKRGKIWEEIALLVQWFIIFFTFVVSNVQCWEVYFKWR